MIRLLCLVAILTGLAGCGGGPLIRDHYFGRAWLEPEREPEPARRDGLGNPILPDDGTKQAAEPTS